MGNIIRITAKIFLFFFIEKVLFLLFAFGIYDLQEITTPKSIIKKKHIKYLD